MHALPEAQLNHPRSRLNLSEKSAKQAGCGEVIMFAGIAFAWLSLSR